MRGFAWSDGDLELLRSLYPDTRACDLAERIGCSIKQVYYKAGQLGLAKSEEFYKSMASGRLLDAERAARTRFKPGQIPWNKGRRFKAGGRSEKTQFKRGNSPHNTHPIGSYRLDKSGVLLRKVSNESGNNSKRWRSVHELVWVAANGPVPNGHIVVFKPGMKTNVLDEITLDRVELVSRASLMKRNSRHNYGEEINEIIRLRAVLTREINKRSGSYGKKQDRRPAGSPVRDYRGAAG